MSQSERQITQAHIDAFMRKLVRRGEDECWPWNEKAVAADTYGTVYVPGVAGERPQPVRANRVSYAAFNGDFDPELVIRHTCDYKPCVNPRHLLTGTPKDNTRDAIERGLKGVWPHRFGSQVATSKLTEDNVREIRKQYASRAATPTQLADRFNVSSRCVRDAAVGRTFAHLTDVPPVVAWATGRPLCGTLKEK